MDSSSFSGQRRVTKAVRQRGNSLLCADSLYGGSLLDGKFKILAINGGNSLTETHFVETHLGVSALEYFQFRKADGSTEVEFAVMGQEDGQVHAYELNEDRKSYKKEVFSVQHGPGVAEFQDDFQNTRFSDSKRGHTNSVTAIEKNPSEYGVFLTASIDGTLTIWKFLVDNGSKEPTSGLVKKPTISQNDVFTKVITVDVASQLQKSGDSKSNKACPITSAKWLDAQTILAATQQGHVLQIKWDKSEEAEVSVALKTKFNPIWSLVLLSASSVALACDSGEVLAYDWQDGKLQNKKLLSKGLRESAFHLSAKEGLLAIGFQSYWEVVRESGEKVQTKECVDNMSSVTLVETGDRTSLAVGRMDGELEMHLIS